MSRLSRSLSLLAALVVASASLALAAVPIAIYVNDKPVSSDVPPQVIEGVTYLPLRAIAEALGCEVQWIPESKIAVLCLGKMCCPVCVTDPASGARLIKGRVLVPLRKVSELLGCQVKWEAKDRHVHISGRVGERASPKS